MSSRDRLVLLVVAAVAAVAASWLLVIQPKRDQAASLNKQVQALQSQLDTARAQVAQGTAARNAYASDYAELVRLGEAVPADENVPSLIYEVQSAANAAGVDFRSLQVGGGSPGPAGAAGSTPSGSRLPTSSGSPTGSSQASGASAGPGGVSSEQFSFSFVGNFFHLADFFDRLQRFVTPLSTQLLVSGRLMDLNSISLSAGPGGFPQITATVSATAYLTPGSQQGSSAAQQSSGAAPAAPSAATPPASAPARPAPSTPSSAPSPTAAVTPPVR